jgi:hypothetical protein
MHKNIHIYICIHIYIYIHTYIHAYINTQTHTHTHKLTKFGITYKASISIVVRDVKLQKLGSLLLAGQKHTHIYIYIYITSTNTYVSFLAFQNHTYTWANIHTWASCRLQNHTGTDFWKFVFGRWEPYIHTYMHTYIHTCIHTCIHTYIHIHVNDVYMAVWTI